MNLVTLSLKDLRRRPTRSLLTVAGVALASAALFSLLAFNTGYNASVRKEVSDSGIHMLVSTEGCPMEAASLALHGGEIPKFLPEDRVPAIRAVPGVRAVTEMLIFSVPGEGNRTDLLGMHLRWDSLSSILYSEELNSITISATLQTTDRRHEILDQKSADFQRAL